MHTFLCRIGTTYNRVKGHFNRPVRKAIAASVAAAFIVLPVTAATAAVPGVKVVHTVQVTPGRELTNAVAVDNSKLLPLLPPGYNLVPASALGLGGNTQGLVAIVNFTNTGLNLDGKPTGQPNTVAVDVGILIAPPPAANAGGLNIPNAFHLYTLDIFTNDPAYKDALLSGGIPAKFFNDITAQSTLDDATGLGDLAVNVPGKRPLLNTVNTGLGHAAVPFPLDAIFWHEGARGSSALHFHNDPLRQGQGIGKVYTQPPSMLQGLLDGGGLGPCPPDAATGNHCVVAPALNFRYPNGGVGELLLIG
jgi:hypothetical protein